MLWLTGGPGCSAFSGLVIEIGNTNSVSKFYFCSILMYVPSDKSRDLEILLYLHVAGPIAFKNEEYNGSLPNLVLRPHSWTKVPCMHLIFCWLKSIFLAFIVFFFPLIMLCLFTGIYHNYFWQVSSIIFVDLAVSTGFTYATTKFATQRRTGYQFTKSFNFLGRCSSKFYCFYFTI